MESIVQIPQHKYDVLVEMANFNEKQIEERALKLYEEKGVHGIRLEIIPQEFSDKFVIKTKAHFTDWDSFFPTRYGEKKKFLKRLEITTFDILERKFGDFLYEINALKKNSMALEARKKLLTTITITGWVMAIIMLSIYLSK